MCHLVKCLVGVKFTDTVFLGFEKFLEHAVLIMPKVLNIDSVGN